MPLPPYYYITQNWLKKPPFKVKLAVYPRRHIQEFIQGDKYKNIYSSIADNSKDLETTQMSLNSRISNGICK